MTFQDKEKFSGELARRRMYMADVHGDGNCFFRAISLSIYGTENKHQVLRKGACDTMEDHPHIYDPLIGDEASSLAEYIAGMRRYGAWAGEREWVAMSHHLKRQLVVYVNSIDGRLVEANGGTDGGPPIRVAFVGTSHYQAIFRKSDTLSSNGFEQPRVWADDKDVALIRSFIPINHMYPFVRLDKAKRSDWISPTENLHGTSSKICAYNAEYQVFRCVDCPFETGQNRSEDALARHWSIVHSGLKRKAMDIEIEMENMKARVLSFLNEFRHRVAVDRGETTGRFRCGLCFFTTDVRKSFKRHVNNHPAVVPIHTAYCSICKAYVIKSWRVKKTQIETHFKSLHSSVEDWSPFITIAFKCVYCEYTNVERWMVGDHMEKSHKDFEPTKDQSESWTGYVHKTRSSSAVTKSQTRIENGDRGSDGVNKSSQPLPISVGNDRSSEDDEIEKDMDGTPSNDRPAWMSKDIAIYDPDTQTYNCSDCLEGQNRGWTVMQAVRHWLGCHGFVRKYECPDCRIVEDAFQVLKRHIEVEHQTVIDIYSTRFENNVYVKRQREAVRYLEQLTVDKRHLLKCKQCNFTTRRDSNLKEHMLLHTGKYKHFCYICDKGMAETRVQKHFRRQHPNIVYSIEDKKKCKDYTPKSIDACKSKYKVLLKPLDCPHCKYTKWFKTDLKEHVVMHSHKYKCDLCLRYFAGKHTLEAHVRQFHALQTTN